MDGGRPCTPAARKENVQCHKYISHYFLLLVIVDGKHTKTNGELLSEYVYVFEVSQKENKKIAAVQLSRLFAAAAAAAP
jgi:hypothetical protein